MVFKVKYFPACSFMQAKVKPSCSYVWRSIAAARSVLGQGSKWRIGNGECISIRKDRWVPDQANGIIPYSMEVLQPDVVVVDLIVSVRGVWKEDMVRRCFSQQDAACILQYPLLPSLPKDVLI